MGYLVRLEFTLVLLLAFLPNHYTIRSNHHVDSIKYKKGSLKKSFKGKYI